MKKLAILFFGAFVLSTSAQATVYDFTAEGDRDEQGYLEFVTGVTNGNPMPTGLTITASDALNGGNAIYAYMDETTLKGPGGMGVCDVTYDSAALGEDQCTPSDDDNQVAGEYVTIIATEDKIVSVKLRGDHEETPNGTFLVYSIDAGDFVMDISGQNGLAWLALESASSFLTYTVRGGEGIYLAALTTVPVPAAVWLFGTAMLGLFGLRRKGKMEAVAA